MAGLFNRLKKWSGLETVKNPDLNGEFDNIINNLGPSGMSGWSQSIAQMQIQTSPGTFGSESLATSTSGEIERIRYQLNAIIGGPDSVWYDTPALSLSQANNLLPTAPPKNRIVSGAVSATSLQPVHLVAAGNAASVTLKCTTIPFVVVINGTTYTFNADITLGSLAVAPGSNNTFALNDSNMTGAYGSKTYGGYVADFAAQPDSTIRILQDYPIIGQTVGTAISALTGTYAAFSYAHGGSTEYFIGWINPNVSGTFISLTKCLRGFFFDSTNTAIPAIAMTNTESVTLMQLIWVYVTTGGALLAVYTHPRYSPVQPSSSASGDMWYDTINQTWKQSNGSTFSVANATLVGVCMTDGTNCKAAKSFDSYRGYSNISNIVPEWLSNTEFRTKYDTNYVSVYGNYISFDKDSVRWTTSNLESGTSLSGNSTYFLYLSENGTPYVSKYFPFRRYDLGGYYHPYNSWRCFGMSFYNGSSHFDSVSFAPFSNLNGEFLNDKSISISKKKTSVITICDQNLTTPPIADIDGIALSTVIVLSSGTATSAASVQDTNSKNITSSLNCTGNPVLIGIVPDYAAPSSTATMIAAWTGSQNITTLQFNYYMDGTLMHEFYFGSQGGSTAGGAGVFYCPIGASFTVLTNIPAGVHNFTLKYLVAGANNTANSANCRLFVKEI